VENVVEERDNRDPKGDKGPLGDNRGAQNFLMLTTTVKIVGRLPYSDIQ